MTKRRTSVPYASATTGTKAREEISKVLRRFGCEASASWTTSSSTKFCSPSSTAAAKSSCAHRPRDGRKCSQGKALELRSPQHAQEYEQAALRQGHVAVNSILRDWIKGQVTAVECGIFSFEAVFMPFMLTADGRPLIERVNELLPKPTNRRSCRCRCREGSSHDPARDRQGVD